MKTIEEVRKLESFDFDCYYCGRHEHWNNAKINEEIDKFISWNLTDEDIIEFFEMPYGDLCDDCVDA